MKKLLIFFFFIFSMSILEAQIVANKTTGCAPLTQVEFSFGQSGNWNFGDGASAIGDIVNHSYSNPGIYDVEYSVGGVVLDQISITVHGNPTPSFSLTDSIGCTPLGTSFTDMSIGGGGSPIQKWDWAFGDGGGSSSQNPNYNYTNVGTYSVSLIVTDSNGCDSSLTKDNLIEVINHPIALFTATPSSLDSCSVPLNMHFTNLSRNSTGTTNNLTYSWDFGEGSKSTDELPGSILYNAAGNYTVNMVVTEGAGCSTSYSSDINVGSPRAEIVLADTVCHNENIVLGNNSIGASDYKWEIQGGSSYNTKNPNHQFVTTGDRTIKLTATRNGCSHDTTISVHVEEIIPDFTRSQTYLCEAPYCFTLNGSVNSNNITQWVYEFDDNSTSFSQDTTYCYPANDVSYYINTPNYVTTELTVTSSNGCKGSVDYTDTIYPISAFFFPNVAQGCAPLNVEFFDSTRSREKIISWEYDFGDGATATTQNPTHVYTAPGDYLVTLIATNELGCKDTSYPVEISVGEILPLNFSLSKKSVCVGESVDITDISNQPELDFIHFQLNDNNRLADCITGSTHTYSGFNQVGLQDVKMTANYNGCSFSATSVGALEVKGPSADLRFTSNCNDPLDYTFIGTIEGADTWHWDFGDFTGVSNSTEASVKHNYSGSGDYTVKLITENFTSGCSNDTAVVEINARLIAAVITGDSIICEGVGYTYSGENSVDEQGLCENTYWWDTGDKTVPRLRKQPTIIYTFDTAGDFSIRLITRDINGCRDTTSKAIKVTGITAGIELNPKTGCLPLTVNASDSSVSDTTVTKWFWSIDGTQYSQAQNNVFTISTPGVKSLELIVQDSLGCTDTTIAQITPIVPDTTFSSISKICVGDSVKFIPTDSSAISSISWIFGDTLGVSKQKSPYFKFDSAGYVDVTLELIDTNGCIGRSKISDYVYVQDYPNAGFSTNYDRFGVVCYPAAIEFTDTSSGSVLAGRSWDFGTGNPIVPNSVVTWNYNLPGSFDVELIVETTNGCQDTAFSTINVVGPVADFEMNTNSICSGEEVVFTLKDTADLGTYEWDFGDGYLGPEGSPISHTYNDVPKGLSTIVQLITYSKDSICKATKIHPLKFKNIAAFFGLSSDTICLNEKLIVTDESVGADTYKWTLSNGSTFANAVLPDLVFQNTGIHDLELIVENNSIMCKDTLTKEIFVHPVPEVFAIDTRFCEGDSAKLKAYSPNKNLAINWSPADFIDDPNNFNTSVNISESTYFTITVTDSNKCQASDTAHAITQKQFDAIYIDTCCVIGESLLIGKNLGDAFNYEWIASEVDKKWLSCKECPIQTIKVDDEVGVLNYTLLYNDTVGCFSNEINYEICIYPRYSFDVPSAFTPDGDGINDVIFLRGHGIKSVVEFKIFNRWGELVFESKELNQGWNGTYKGREQNIETYGYKATVEFYNGERATKGGSISLMR